MAVTPDTLRAELQEAADLAISRGELVTVKAARKVAVSIGFDLERAISVADAKTALYRHFDKQGRLLYVGVSLNAIGRLAAHRANAAWLYELAKIDVEWHPSRAAALKAEARAIKSERPLHNKRHAGSG